METTDQEVERAFQEWCAMMGVNPLSARTPGGFRLATDAEGQVHLDQLVGEAGEVRQVAPPMTRREFCAAVHFVHESMNIKTVQLARSVSRKRKR